MNKDFIHIASSIRSPGGTIAECSAQLLDIQPALNSRAQSVPDHSRLSARTDEGGILPSSAAGIGCVLRHNRLFFPVTKPIRVGCLGERGSTYNTARRLTTDLPWRYTSWYSRFLHSLFSFFELIHRIVPKLVIPKNGRRTEKFLTGTFLFIS